MTTIPEVVVGATKKKLAGQVLQENGSPANITGSTIRLQGRSATLTAVTIDATATITDAANGLYEVSLGSLVSSSDLTGASLSAAVFRLRIKTTDVAAKVDYGDLFEIKWSQDPLVL